jgi:hypothetical protein
MIKKNIKLCDDCKFKISDLKCSMCSKDLCNDCLKHISLTHNVLYKDSISQRSILLFNLTVENCEIKCSSTHIEHKKSNHNCRLICVKSSKEKGKRMFWNSLCKECSVLIYSALDKKENLYIILSEIYKILNILKKLSISDNL